MTTISNETLLDHLADEKLDDKRRAAAAEMLTDRNLRIVCDKNKTAPWRSRQVDTEATLDMWEHPCRVEHWGRKRLPVVDAADVLDAKVFELDPYDLTPLDDDGFNPGSGADWKAVKPKLRRLVRWGAKRGRLAMHEPVGLASHLSSGKVPPLLQQLKLEATEQELKQAAAELQATRRPTAHHAQQEVGGVVIEGDISDPRTIIAIAGAIGAVQTGSGNSCSVDMGRETRMHDFLASAFNVDTLRGFVTQFNIQNSIGWSGSLATVAFQAAELLSSHGLSKYGYNPFWAALRHARPGRIAEINRLQELAPKL